MENNRLEHQLTYNSETKQKSLEEIAAAFGDKLALVDEDVLPSDKVISEDKGYSQHENSAKSAGSAV